MDAHVRDLQHERGGADPLCAVPPQEPHGHANVALSLQSQRLPLRDRRSQRRAPLPPRQLDRRQRHGQMIIQMKTAKTQLCVPRY